MLPVDFTLTDEGAAVLGRPHSERPRTTSDLHGGVGLAAAGGSDGGVFTTRVVLGGACPASPSACDWERVKDNRSKVVNRGNL